MKHTGRSFSWQESPTRITDAVVTDTRIAIDWLENDEQACLIANSSDGVEYEGTFGYPVPEKRFRVKFRLFRDRTGEVLLMGRWSRTDAAEGSNWLLRLSPRER